MKQLFCIVSSLFGAIIQVMSCRVHIFRNEAQDMKLMEKRLSLQEKYFHFFSKNHVLSRWAQAVD